MGGPFLTLPHSLERENWTLIFYYRHQYEANGKRFMDCDARLILLLVQKQGRLSPLGFMLLRLSSTLDLSEPDNHYQDLGMKEKASYLPH